MPRGRPQGHPQGVEPWGNLLFSQVVNIRSSGLGNLSVLGDDLLLNIFNQLPAHTLAHCAVVSRTFYCFANHDELWRAHTLEEFEGSFRFRHSWRSTYISRLGSKVEYEAAKLKVKGMFSDLLYQPYLCAVAPISAAWLRRQNIDKRSQLTLHGFHEQYELPNRPVVITDVVDRWPACHKWTRSYLESVFQDHDVVVGDYPMKFEDYLMYCDASTDDMPLYLFDKDFVKKAPHLAHDFEVPSLFQDDLFSVLDNESRPDFRWLIMGPARSGSSFHKDPNATSAWNAVIKGSKKWILFPPNSTPPGVKQSLDGADVATTLSLVEWFLNFYGQSQEGPVCPLECTVEAGELLFVPHGWWHMAMNLEETIAVTQNYVGAANLHAVLDWLASRDPRLISGCTRDSRSTLYERFLERLRERRPQVLDAMAAKAKGDSARIPVCRFKSGANPPPVGLDLPAAISVMPKSRPAAEVSGPQFTFSFVI